MARLHRFCPKRTAVLPVTIVDVWSGLEREFTDSPTSVRRAEFGTRSRIQRQIQTGSGRPTEFAREALAQRSRSTPLGPLTSFVPSGEILAARLHAATEFERSMRKRPSHHFLSSNGRAGTRSTWGVPTRLKKRCATTRVEFLATASAAIATSEATAVSTIARHLSRDGQHESTHRCPADG